ncbi:nitric oxide reductase activation protein NorD [Blautia pseudococcoides]|uniref:vWA domain-containing protein n=1 Tax=Blautia pseudococcoides TaxID=1796616 RepID=UPI00148B163A|nr:MULTISPECIES: nitric oxide reductase activation protein NorD [Lachnospiraceae]QJU16797.1 nitric oxide reductase activation protein NorD [Blautia pseudococcoides]
MVRVNHKLVKQRLNEQRSKISDRQFFSSRLLAGHFEDLAAAQTRRYRYNRRVRVNLYWKPREKHVASTDNMLIRINAGNSMVTKVKGRENRYQIVCGMFAHELGHVLYTDFLAAQTHTNYLGSYRWYPYPPDLKTTADARNEKAFWDYVKTDPKNLEMVQMVSHYISNVIEDGYIENRMLNNFPGTLGYGLEKLREQHFEHIETVTQLIENEDEGKHIFESILQIMLSYVKFGEIKYGDEPLSDERIQSVFGLITDIDSALMSKSGKDRLNVVNMVLVRCWDYIESFCEECKKRQEEAEASGGSTSLAETLSEVLGAIAGGSEMGEGNSTPVPEASGETEESATADKRAQTHADAENEDDSQTDSETEENPSGSGESDNSSDEDAIPLNGRNSGSGKEETSDNEQGRIPYHQSESLSEPVGGSVEKNEDYEREHYDRAAADIERLLDKMAEKAACEQLENERIQELNDVAQNISYGNIHEGVPIRINRIASVDEELIEQYNAIAGPLINISRQLQKSLQKQLKENRRGGKLTGLIMGRRLDVHALCRNDGKVFYKNNLPNEIPELAVGLLLDESGSMCSCDRCTYARASAIILYDFCQSLDIPVMVYGHSTDYTDVGNTVALYSYAEFDGFDHDDKYRMMDIAARGSNRDGAALRFVAEQLSKRPEAVKILILVSDGQPADSGYSGSAAEEDLRGIKQEYQRKGILFVAAAIGDDKQNIERIYGDSFMDISDLKQLPTKLTAVVKRHIRV